MSTIKTTEKRRVGAMELLGIGGFSCFVAWMLSVYYWEFVSQPTTYTQSEHLFAELFIFVGLVIGYFLIHKSSRRFHAIAHSRPLMIVCFLFSVLLPTLMLLAFAGIVLSPIVFGVVGLFTGIGASYFTTSWLDVCGNVRIQSYFAFTSASFVGGGILALLVCLMPTVAQPIFSIVCIALSGGLLSFVALRTPKREEPPVAPRSQFLKFTKEVEPSLLVYGIVFGLMFVFLLQHGWEVVLLGIVSIIIGAGIVLFVDVVMKRSINITTIQRILLVLTVAACLVMPFANKNIEVICICVVIGSWGALLPINYALLTKHASEAGLAVFFQVPLGASINAIGFAIGWFVAAGLIATNAAPEFFTATLLGMAFVLVVVFMLFLPNVKHHAADEEAEKQQEKEFAVQTSHSVAGSDDVSFEERCQAVADMFQLSPREGDILVFLAKGRNTSYIQNKLTISPHTVKSHIYSIYRKLDIHSQQKLMDFVEEYPIEKKDQ